MAACFFLFLMPCIFTRGAIVAFKITHDRCIRWIFLNGIVRLPEFRIEYPALNCY